MNFVLYNAMLYDEAVDICVKNGHIDSVKPTCGTLPDGAYDAMGKKVFPSFLDAHTHTREPGFTHKETIATALRAALHGGFSGICCMANTKPVNDTVMVTEYMLHKARSTHPKGPFLYPIGATTVGLEGKELAPMHALAKAGCIAFSNDGSAIMSSAIIRNAMEYAHTVDSFIIEHCEDASFGASRPMNEGVTSSLLGLQGDPDISESIHVARALLMAEYLGISIHLAHISSHRSVALIADAKKRGVRVTAETCPHYLLLDDTAVMGYNTYAKVNPPLRTKKDNAVLIQALKEGIIDMLATDHAPHTLDEKDSPFVEAPFGFSGLDVALALTWRLVETGEFTEHDVVRLWCEAPHKRFGLPYTTFAQGSEASFFLFDANVQWQLTEDSMYSQGKNTPFLGEMMRGKVTDHWIRGEKVL